MYLFCPKCQAQHPAAGRCPRCSSRLLSPGEAAEVMARAPEPPSEVIHTTLVRRVVVGSVVALGLHLAFREWAMAVLAATGGSADGGAVWLNFTLRLVGTVVGGVLAGAGRRMGFGGGAAVGAVSGFAWVAVDAFPHIQTDPVAVGLAVGLAGVGAAAAAAGGVVWPAPVDLPAPDVSLSRNSSLLRLKPGDGRKKVDRPTRWVRVVVAVTVAVCGVLAADMIREALGKLPKGLFNLAAGKRVDAQITGFLLLVAGMLGGATTGAAVRHGLIAGLVVGLAVAGLAAVHPDGPPPGVEFVTDQLDMSGQPGAAAAGGVALAVVVVGAWLGGQLFPPLARKKKLARG
jgi:hypothetical protein